MMKKPSCKNRIDEASIVTTPLCRSRRSSKQLFFRKDTRRDRPPGWEIARYKKQLDDYEGYFLSPFDNGFRRNRVGSIGTACPSSEFVKEAAKSAIKKYNKSKLVAEALKLKKVIRSNLLMTAGLRYYLTLQASDNKFYETKVEIFRGDRVRLIEFRPAKYYPVLRKLPLTKRRFN